MKIQLRILCFLLMILLAEAPMVYGVEGSGGG